MGTRSVIAIQEGDGWRGRYVHWDGYPAGVGVALLRMYGETFAGNLPRMIQVLTGEYVRWSTVTAEREPELAEYQHGGNLAAVRGVGTGYRLRVPDEPDEWITSDGDGWGTEWCYVLSDQGVHVMEATRDGGHAMGVFGFNPGASWRYRVRVPWRPLIVSVETMRSLGG